MSINDILLDLLVLTLFFAAIVVVLFFMSRYFAAYCHRMCPKIKENIPFLILLIMMLSAGTYGLIKITSVKETKIERPDDDE